MIEPAPNGDPARSTVELGTVEAMRLLASAPIGRIVFSRQALPAIRPVNHLVVDGRIIVRARLDSRLTSAVRPVSSVVVAYEADEFDPVRRLGWSVVVTGLARTVTDPERITEYERLLRPWVDSVTDTVIEIEPSIVTGIRLIEKRR
ncbi:pyridoxamine 5'-phosphate oxidase family protein [Nocardia sp. CA-107356]|uniref:pyridoxamine 5'-phosphate oxidase family protein n=1 Tax=Nocardia sp. CA-107356 TaxID=3239972 RepID=UPI003D8C6411